MEFVFEFHRPGKEIVHLSVLNREPPVKELENHFAVEMWDIGVKGHEHDT